MGFNMKILDFFYTEHQAAEILGVTPMTIWRWIKQNKFDAQHIGRVVLIPKWEVELLKVTKRRKYRGAKV